MTVENYLAEAGMFVGLAGVLAGFSISASSAMFLYGLLVSMVSFAARAELN